MAAAAGVEPATCSLGESRSIQLSYATAFCLCRKNKWTCNCPFDDRLTGPFLCCFRARIYYTAFLGKNQALIRKTACISKPETETVSRRLKGL